MIRFSVSALILVLSVFVISNYSFSQGNSAEVNTLKGLKSIGIGVGVEQVDTDATAAGLDTGKLRNMIIKKLKKSGIKVLSDQEVGTVKGQPMLFVNLNTVKQPGPIFIYTTALDLTQVVVLDRNRGLTSISPTWTVLTTGGALPEDLYKSVEASLEPMLDSFIVDFKKANP